MEDLKTQVHGLVMDEYNRASAKFGRWHHSHHEAYAVILEEVEEAKIELSTLDDYLKRYWFGVKANAIDYQDDNAERIVKHAIAAAAELIQVAAMAYKATLSGGGTT